MEPKLARIYRSLVLIAGRTIGIHVGPVPLIEASTLSASPLEKTLRGLGRVTARARQLAATKKSLWPLLPEDVQPHCDLANYRDGVLVMTASSPVWATRLRQSSAQIIHRARGNIKMRIDRIEVRIVPAAAPPRPPAPPKEISATARNHLRRCAAIVGRTEDPED